MASRKGNVDFEGASLAYEEEGDGPPLLLIHAANTDGRMWSGVAPALANHHRVIRYDMRGMGCSTMGSGAYSAWGDIAALLDALGIAACAVVGVSAGGSCALELALALPQRVATLVLVSAGLFEPIAPESADHAQHSAELAAAVASFDLDAMAESYAQMWLDGPGQPPSRVAAPVRAQFLAIVREAFTRRAKFRFPQLLPNPRSRLPEIACPTLILDGELDFPEVRAFAGLFASEIPGARRISMQGVAHLPPLERPEEFIRLVEGFLEEIEGSSSCDAGGRRQ